MHDGKLQGMHPARACLVGFQTQLPSVHPNERIIRGQLLITTAESRAHLVPDLLCVDSVPAHGSEVEELVPPHAHLASFKNMWDGAAAVARAAFAFLP